MILSRLKNAIRDQNWFAVVLEVCIVIVGVVIGFQITAWGQDWSDRAKEQTYLQQLAGDLRETERALIEADSFHIPIDSAGIRLLHAFYQSDPPSRDSLVGLLDAATSIRPVRPVLGTVEALVSTGDLSLITNDSLRTNITAYLDDSERLIDANADMFRGFFDAFRGLRTRVDLGGMVEDALSPEAALDRRESEPYWPIPESPRIQRFPFIADTFLADREALTYVQILNETKRNLWFIRRLMKEAAIDLREQVEAELDR